MLYIVESKLFSTVEGTVSNFDPMPYGGHKHERFTVNGVHFEYSDFNEEFYGLNQTKCHGGSIEGNGMKVRIDYVNGKNINHIFKLIKLE